jgi:hypothetical protein
VEVSGPLSLYAMTLCVYLLCLNLIQDLCIEGILVFNLAFFFDVLSD